MWGKTGPTVRNAIAGDIAAAVAAGADGATDVAMDATGERNLALRGRRSKPPLQSFPPQFRVLMNPAERSRLDRQRDTSRYFFRGNRFPNTAD